MDNSKIENNEPKEKADFYTNLQKEWDSMTEEDRMSYGEFFALDAPFTSALLLARGPLHIAKQYLA